MSRNKYISANYGQSGVENTAYGIFRALFFDFLLIFMDLRASRNDILENTNTYTQLQIFFLIFGLNSNKKSVRKCAELIRGTSARVVLKCEYINYLKDLNFLHVWDLPLKVHRS